MPDRGVALQEAIYSILSAGLSPVPVYDRVPQGAAKPYVVIGDETAALWDYVSGERENRSITLTVWSTYGGQKQVKEILAAIRTLLHGQRPALSTGRVVGSWLMRTWTDRSDDGETFMGACTLRVVTEP